MADSLAKLATSRPLIDIPLQKTMAGSLHDIDDYITKLWQDHYDNCPYGAFYKLVEPTVTRTPKFISPNPTKEKTITRLRFGIVKLNYYLYKIKEHPDGLCTTCNVPETINHILTSCTRYNFNLPTNLPIHKILSSKQHLDHMYDIVVKNKLHL